MSTSVFSTIDRLTSGFKPIDRLLTTVAARLLPQHEASSVSCDNNYHPCGFLCGDFCSPTSDIRFETLMRCCHDALPLSYGVRVGCDNCG